MGNRFAGLPGYKNLIKGHGVIAVMTFLFIVPAAILVAQFYGRNPYWALRMHIYLQILTVALATVVFTLGWFAVGPARSLTNPHHGIGTAIYVLVLIQAIGGWWVHKREKGKRRRKMACKLYLHQWLGRAIALLGFAQVALGLTLYGSPKFTFILYTLWMTFLLVLFFILSYRALPPLGGFVEGSIHGTVIEEKKPSRFGGLLGPLAAGAGLAALMGTRRNRDRSRSRSRNRVEEVEVIPSRRGSRSRSRRRDSRRDSAGSFIEEEKYEGRRKEGGGIMDKVLKGAAVLGAAGLAKSWYDRRQRGKGDRYASVAPDTPSRRHGSGRHNDSELSEESRMEEGRRPGGPILPGPGNPLAAAAVMSAPRPTTPRRPGRAQSFDSGSYSYDSRDSPSRRPQSPSHGVRDGLLAGLGLGFIAKRLKDRRDKKELERLDRVEADRVAEERRARQGATPSRLTGDGFPPSSRRDRRPSRAHSSDLSSVIDNPHSIRPGGIPPIPAALVAGGAGGAAAAAMSQSRSRHDVTESVNMPPAPPDPHGILRQEESGSEAYESAGGHPHRRHSQRRRREGEEAAAAAVAAAAGLAAEEEARRRRSRSRGGASDVVSPPVSVKVKVHGDKDRNVTLRRLTEQEAAAEREARRRERRRRADSVSSLSGTDTGNSRRRYRRDEREAEVRAEASVPPPPPPPPPPAMAPLNPPNPAFAAGRRPKDSAYYSGRPGEASGSGGGFPGGGGSVGTPESHGTWSAMSPSVSGGDGADPTERRRRRRLERNQRPPQQTEFN
jgi:hypothetical protein